MEQCNSSECRKRMLHFSLLCLLSKAQSLRLLYDCLFITSSFGILKTVFATAVRARNRNQISLNRSSSNAYYTFQILNFVLSESHWDEYIQANMSTNKRQNIPDEAAEGRRSKRANNNRDDTQNLPSPNSSPYSGPPELFDVTPKLPDKVFPTEGEWSYWKTDHVTFINSPAGLGNENWVGKRPLGAGTFGTAGLWELSDKNNVVIEVPSHCSIYLVKRLIDTEANGGQRKQDKRKLDRESA